MRILGQLCCCFAIFYNKILQCVTVKVDQKDLGPNKGFKQPKRTLACRVRSGRWGRTSPLALAFSTTDRKLSIWAGDGGVKSAILMWWSCSSGHESWWGGFLSHRQTRCLIPPSSRYRYSHGILGKASPASLPGSTQEKLCGAKESMSLRPENKRHFHEHIKG